MKGASLSRLGIQKITIGEKVSKSIQHPGKKTVFVNI